MGAALGLALQPGDAVISIGTSGTVYAVAEHPTADSTGAVAGFADATGRYLPLVCTLNATKVTDTVARLLGVDHVGLDALAMAAPIGARGVTLLPYLDGERTPNRPKASGTFGGVRSDATREQFARAAFEGVACGLLDGLDALREHVADVQRVVLVGGGTKSHAYRQILADLCDVPVFVADAEQAVAAGACVQAAAVLQEVDPMIVAQRWGLGSATFVAPSDGLDDDASTSVRAAYAVLRDRMA
jgi:xylulokinase